MCAQHTVWHAPTCAAHFWGFPIYSLSATLATARTITLRRHHDLQLNCDQVLHEEKWWWVFARGKVVCIFNAFSSHRTDHLRDRLTSLGVHFSSACLCISPPSPTITRISSRRKSRKDEQGRSVQLLPRSSRKGRLQQCTQAALYFANANNCGIILCKCTLTECSILYRCTPRWYTRLSHEPVHTLTLNLS